MKKIIKTITSRMFYLVLGIALVFTVFAVNAAWNTTYSTGNQLTASGFNDVVNKLVELNTRVGVLESGTGGFGAWQVMSEDTTYTAATDGFVAAITPSSAGVTSGYTPAGTLRAVDDNPVSGEGIMFPVKSGDTWRVDNTSNVANVYWIPFN